MKHPPFVGLGGGVNSLMAAVGIIPTFLDLDDPRPAKEQIAERYISGWFPFQGFIRKSPSMVIQYEDDPPMRALAYAQFRDEDIWVYPHGWTMIMQSNGDWEIARLD